MKMRMKVKIQESFHYLICSSVCQVESGNVQDFLMDMKRYEGTISSSVAN
jgi:hypothetical protein